MDLEQDIRQLLERTGPGRMPSTAYDTAWIARLDGPMGRCAVAWLRAHQLSDGSWGASQPRYYHDRAICTLAAMTALAIRGEARDSPRLRRAQWALETVLQGLPADPVGETIGFEMIMPSLLAEAQALGIVPRWQHPLRREDDLPVRLARQRVAKLTALPKGMVNRFVTVAFSAEMTGSDSLDLLDTENLQEANGSVGHSPSATAYFLLHVRHHDPAALAYLQEITANDDGGIPDVAPFDVFERAWVLWNLALAGPLDGEWLAWCRPHLDFLEAAWVPGLGAGFAAGYTPKDGDGTSVVYEVLTRFGRQADLEAVLYYEALDHFHCYKIESNASTSTNVHVLGALRQAGLGIRHPAVQKVLGFLGRTQSMRLFWFDKWHVSPYYPTTHAVIAAAGYCDELLGEAVTWILDTQNADGSWGYYMPTAEETAYCLQALVTCKRQGHRVPDDALKCGAMWLARHKDSPYPPLWVGKCLYSPTLVIRSAILSALALVAQEE